ERRPGDHQERDRDERRDPYEQDVAAARERQRAVSQATEAVAAPLSRARPYPPDRSHDTEHAGGGEQRQEADRETGEPLLGDVRPGEVGGEQPAAPVIELEVGRDRREGAVGDLELRERIAGLQPRP